MSSSSVFYERFYGIASSHAPKIVNSPRGDSRRDAWLCFGNDHRNLSLRASRPATSSAAASTPKNYVTPASRRPRPVNPPAWLGMQDFFAVFGETCLALRVSTSFVSLSWLLSAPAYCALRRAGLALFEINLWILSTHMYTHFYIISNGIFYMTSIISLLLRFLI